MTPGLDSFARDSNFFLQHRLIPAVVIGLTTGAIVGVAVGLWQGSTWLGVGSGFVSAIVVGALLDLCTWHW